MLPPHTPASKRALIPSSSIGDHSSEYYTATWGSPYDRSSVSRSARTAASEQADSDDDDLSPGPGLGLEHLIPSRIKTESSTSLHAAPDSPPVDSDDELDLTPRSRTRRWIHLPESQVPEKPRWSRHSSGNRPWDQDQTPANAIGAPDDSLEDIPKGHRAREQNRTLDQQTFWHILRESRRDNMSGMQASRWAATPPVAEIPETETHASDDPILDTRKSEEQRSALEDDAQSLKGVEAAGFPAASNKSTPEAYEQNEPEKEETVHDTLPLEDLVPGEKERKAPQVTTVVGNAPESKAEADGGDGRPSELMRTPTLEVTTVPTSGAPGSHDNAIPTPSEPARLEPPRLRKRVSWRGKKFIICIPHMDFDALGLARPMDYDEVQQRLKRFQDEGYETSGFDGPSDSQPHAHVKPIFPDEAESRAWDGNQMPTVQLPDLDAWQQYMDDLVEAKLAALGVSLGTDEPSSISSQDLSRQSSGQYPPLPFSPPIPTGSAASMGRPGFVRGHSHTMSVASPASPLNGPFGHMHRHSTFHGFSHMPAQQPQDFRRHPSLPGMPAFSPPPQFAGAQMPRMASPAQFAALRGEPGLFRGPGSPLGQSMMPESPQDYSRTLAEDQRRRQASFGMNTQQPPPLRNTSAAQRTPVGSAPILPELPENEDEEELSGPMPYVPPQKRAQINSDIAVPTPRGHRHNISEGLEREVQQAEQHRGLNGSQMPDPRVNGLQQLPEPFAQQTRSVSAEKGPLGGAYSVEHGDRGHQKSVSRFNIGAPSFTFNPGASFQPSSMRVASGAQTASAPTNHQRRTSSGNLHVTAKEFKPSGITAFKPATAFGFRPSTGPSMPSSDFNFSSQGPAFIPDAPADQPSKSAGRTIVDDLPNLFSQINVPDIVKPTKKSKAVAIVRPSEGSQMSDSNTDVDDESGRIGRGDERQKRTRTDGVDDNDEVPQFAEPTPIPDLPAEPAVPSQAADGIPDDDVLTAEPIADEETERTADDDTKSVVEKVDEAAAVAIEDMVRKASETVDSAIDHLEASEEGGRPARGSHHQSRSSLSALAQPWQPGNPRAELPDGLVDLQADGQDSISSLEEGELREDDVPEDEIPEDESQLESSERLPSFEPPETLRFPPQEHSEGIMQEGATFDDIDAVMRHLNAEIVGDDTNKRKASPEPSANVKPPNGVTYIRGWSRSDAPSPSPRRQYAPYCPPAESPSNARDGDRFDENGWPPINRLNKAKGPPSDWSDLVSQGEDEKLQARGAFFDHRINDVVGRVLAERLQPFEQALHGIQLSLSRRAAAASEPQIPKQRSSSAMESDADDEDDSEAYGRRPISRGRDQKLGGIKAVMLEALREQSPRRPQAFDDIADLHSALADMKVSFARAASASLELEDIRAVVEEVVGRQGQALVPIALDNDGTESQRRQLTELEGRLNETLTGALEQANHTRQVEQREAETRRMLRLAEEELRVLRESNHDDESRVLALEEERARAVEEAEEAEEAQAKAEDRLKTVEAEGEAIQATLEEYRLSSSKWRQEIDDGKREREELESAVAALERQLDDAQDSGRGVRRRLEKLQADMATAVGQLTSDKSRWKSQVEDFRARCDALESRGAAHARERGVLEEEIRLLRVVASQAAEAKMVFGGVQCTTDSLDEMVRTLRNDLAEQQALATRFEREAHEARETGRAEVLGTRMAMETDAQAASHQVSLLRAELEGELARVRAELYGVKGEAEAAKERHALILEQEAEVQREAFREATRTNAVALDGARSKYEAAIKDLTQQHGRSLAHALEDKGRSEYLLNERLALANDKLQHFQDKVLHLEDRVEVAKSAAQAAAMNAQTSKAGSVPAHGDSLPEKISPQALRESILVLQEQLQDRESRIEGLQHQVQHEGPAKLKESEAEIAWLRELLGVRNEELTDLVNTLARPSFDRDSIRDTAIRIRANLQMEQQEKERPGQGGGTLSGQALASLSSFATPKATQLTSAFNKWRSSMESSALKSRQAGGPGPTRSYTPSRARGAPRPPAHMNGLMTPPASNVRSTPSPEAVNSLPAPRLPSRGGSQSRSGGSQSHSGAGQDASPPQSRDGHEPPSTPTLFGESGYDDDAEDREASMSRFEDEEDEDLDVADSEPPAFMNLEAELEPVEPMAEV